MRYLGVDFGLRRVGLAISRGELASPLDTIRVKGLRDAAAKVSEFAKSQEFTKIVVGLPEGKMGQVVYGFIKALKRKGFEIETTDETLSSQKAVQVMVELKFGKKARRFSDAQAAAIILQNFLDSK